MIKDIGRFTGGSVYLSQSHLKDAPWRVHLNFLVGRCEVEMDTHLTPDTGMSTGYIEVRITPEQMDSLVQTWLDRKKVAL